MNISSRHIFSALLLFAAPTAACHWGDEDPLTRDAGFPDATVLADSGVEPDAGVSPDAETFPDATPRRVMIEKKLFGEMPLDNAVVDPAFDLSSQNWYAISDPTGANAAYAPITKHHYAMSPGNMPAVEMKKAPVNSNDVLLLGNVAAFAAPAQASVWIGRHAADGERSMRAALAITNTVGQVQALELQPDGADPVTADDVVWTRYTARIDVAPVGISTFVLSDDSEISFLASSPVITNEQLDKTKSPKLAVKRAPTLGEARALRMISKKRLDRMVPATRARADQKAALRRALDQP